MNANEFNKIFESNLDGYESDFDTEQGWAQLETALPKKIKRRLIVLFLMGPAAAALVFTVLYLNKSTLPISTTPSDHHILSNTYPPVDQEPSIIQSESSPIARVADAFDDMAEDRTQSELTSTDITGQNIQAKKVFVQSNVKEPLSRDGQNPSRPDQRSGIDIATIESHGRLDRQNTTPVREGIDDGRLQATPATTVLKEGMSDENDALKPNLNNEKKKSPGVHLLPLLPIDAFTTTKGVVKLPFEIILDDIEKADIEESRRLAISFEAGAGLYTHNYSFSNPDAPAAGPSSLLNELESFSSALKVHLPITDRLTVQTGIEYQKINEHFSHALTTPVTRVTEAVQRITINTSTGDSTFVIGQVNQAGTKVRNVSHYNEYDNWSIPIEMSYRFTSGKVVFNPGAGLVFNISSRKSGKEAFNNDIILSESSDLYKTSTGLSVQLHSEVAYQLDRLTSVTLKPSIRKSMTNWSTKDGVSMKPIFYQIRVGIKRNL